MSPLFRSEITLGSDPHATLGRQVEADVFLEAFGNTPETLAKEYDPYEPVTVMVTIVEEASGRPAGAARLLIDEPSKLKSVQDLGRAPWSKDITSLLEETSGVFQAPRALDVATLAVTKDFRGRGTNGVVSMALYRSTLRLTKALGIEPMVAVFDVKVLNLVNRLFGRPWHFYPGVAPAEYLGSTSSAPAWCTITDFEKATLLNRPEVHSLVFTDSNDDGVLYPSWEEMPQRFASLLA